MLKPKCVGRFEENGTYTFGLDGPRAKSHGSLLKSRKPPTLLCGVVSDTLLALGASGDVFLLFSIDGGEIRRGQLLYQMEKPNHYIQKVLFSPDGTEIVLFFSIRGSSNVLCQIYSASNFLARPVQRRPLAFEQIFIPLSEVCLNLSYQKEKGLYQYALRDAKFARDGRKLMVCTNHVHGSAMVVILCKEQTQWKYWGDDQITVHGLDAWDDICIGFTGVSLYPACETSNN